MNTLPLTVAFVSNLEDYQNSKTAKAESREIAARAVVAACEAIKGKLIKVSCRELVKAQTEAVDTVFNSDVLLVDTLFNINEQSVVLYYIGVRESLKLKSNAILYMAEENKLIHSIFSSVDEGQFLFPYIINESGVAVYVDPTSHQFDNEYLTNLMPQMIMNLPNLSKKLQAFLQDAHGKTGMYMECKFLKALRKDREILKGEELLKKVKEMRSRLDDPEMLSADILLNFFLSYKQAEAYNEMIDLFESVERLETHKHLLDAHIRYYYAFALNRRNQPGTSEKSLDEIKKAIATCKKPSPDMYGLLGRIYKEKVRDSNNTDQEALKLAIESYRQGFLEHQSTYLGVNLATLLLIAGQTRNSIDLQNVCNQLNLFIGRKGNLEDMTDYWDVATFFEIRVLSEDYPQAIRAAACMYKLDPPTWALASTLDNIRLIIKSRKIRSDNDHKSAVDELFDFWLAFFDQAVQKASVQSTDKSPEKKQASSAAESDLSHQDSLDEQPTIVDEDMTMKEDDEDYQSSFRIRFDLLIVPADTTEPLPAALQINRDIDEPHISIHFIDPRMNAKYCCRDRVRFGATASQNSRAMEKLEDWRMSMMDPAELLLNATSDLTFYEKDIKGISLNTKNKRSVYFFAVSNSEIYNFVFPSEAVRSEFYSAVRRSLLTDNGNYLLNDKDESDELQFSYERTPDGELVVLGSGSYGVVYSGYLPNWNHVAIKEIKNVPQKDQQTLIEEINLHSRLHHENIVQYIGCAYEDGVFKIIMERVLGSSLTYALKKFGPLNHADHILSNYCMQILEGIRYLHENKIIHRDIKGDNILVDMHTGILKIADFGGSKRLSGLLEKATTFAGSMRYMAPELIKSKADGYDYPADIWSFGCTVVEMITGKLPFIEFEDPIAAMYHAATYNEHPALPDDISEPCRDFTLRCFAPATSRATAEQLLHDHFLKLIRKQNQKRRGKASSSAKPSPLPESVNLAGRRNVIQRQISRFKDWMKDSLSLRIRVNSENLPDKFFSSSVSVAPTVSRQTPPIPRKREAASNSGENLHPINTGHQRHRSLLTPSAIFLSSPSPITVDQAFDGITTSNPSIPSTSSPNSPMNGSAHSSRLDAFNVIKSTDQAKSALANEMINKREGIVNWILERTVKIVRLPALLHEDSVRAASPSLVALESSITPTTPLSSREINEREVVELVFDLMVDYLRGGKSMSSQQRCLNTCIRNLEVRSFSPAKSAAHKLSASHSFDGSLPEYDARCQSLFTLILQPHYRGGGSQGKLQDPSVNLLISFLTTAWSQFNSIPQCLKSCCDQPHKLLAWVKLLKDACAIAIGQFSYSDTSKAPLRRHRTLGGHQTASYYSSPNASVDVDAQSQELTHPFKRVTVRSPNSALPSDDLKPPTSDDKFIDDGADGIDLDGASSEQGVNIYSRKSTLKRNIYSTRNIKRPYLTSQRTNVEVSFDAEKNRFFEDLIQVLKTSLDTYNDAALKNLQTMFSHQRTQSILELDSEALCGITTGFNSLSMWLHNLGVSVTDIEKIVLNNFEESDFLQLITKDDLYRIGICGGSVLRIWKAVCHLRQHFLAADHNSTFPPLSNNKTTSPNGC